MNAKLKQQISYIKAATTSVWAFLHKIYTRIKKFLKKTKKNLQPLYKSSWMLFTILLLIVIAQLTLLWRPIVGVYFNSAALAILVGLGLWSKTIRQLAISVAIIPVATMVVLTIPQTTIFARSVVFYDVLLVLGLIYRFMFTLDYPLKSTRLSLKSYAYALHLWL